MLGKNPNLFLLVGMATIMALSSGAAQAAPKTKKLDASRKHVHSVCKRYGGLGFGTLGRRGSFGCYFKNDAWISCDEKGKCVGQEAPKKRTRTRH